MGLFDFWKSKRANAMPDSFDDFYDALAHGSDGEINSFIYRGEILSDGERQACVNGITFHCRAPNEDGRLIEKSRQLSSSGEFILLIVVASWQDDVEDNFVPLIVTAQNGQVKIAGIVLPFDGLMTKLKGNVCSQIGELSAAWVIRKIQARGE